MTLRFEILGEPVAKGRPRLTSFGGHARAYTPKKTRDAEDNIRAQVVRALPVGWRPIETAICVRIIIRRTKPVSIPKSKPFPTQKPDIDNYVKSVLDAMNSVVFKDDAQIVLLEASKHYGIPSIFVEIDRVPEDTTCNCSLCVGYKNLVKEVEQ